MCFLDTIFTLFIDNMKYENNDQIIIFKLLNICIFLSLPKQMYGP